VSARAVAVSATLALASLAVALAVARSGGPPDGAARPTARETPAAVVASPPPLALAGLRDIFRFADDHAGVSSPAAQRVEEAPAPPMPAAPPSGPRLVGLVWRSGRRIAALAVDGEVVLAEPGDVAGGITVLSVDDESVRVRRGDGSESLLVLP
jgi:hypothetical protein